MGKYILDHWNGQHPLWKSYWINAVLISMVVGGILGLVLGFALGAAGVTMSAAGWKIIAAWLTVPIQVWGSVGVWRAAETYTLTTQKLWGRLAQVAVVLGFLKLFTAMLGL